MKMPTLIIFLFICTLSLVEPIDSAFACPNCKNAFSQSDGDSEVALKEMAERERVGRAYNYSILFMMPLPFLVAAGLGAMLYHQTKKKQPSHA